MEKPLIFISHITEEKEIAQALKDSVESTFLRMVEVFVSSSPTSIKVGRKWLDGITDALKACKVEIILASPESIKRPWINFEAGGGWVRDIHVIPICHSGMTPDRLPAPLGSLQSVEATDLKGLGLVFSVISEAVGCALPVVDFTALLGVIESYEATSKQIQAMENASPQPATSGLLPYELATLVEIGDSADSPDETVSVRRVRDALYNSGLKGIAVSLAIKALERKGLVELTTEQDYNGNQFAVIRLSNEGWLWLEENKQSLELRTRRASNAASVGQEFPDNDVPF